MKLVLALALTTTVSAQSEAPAPPDDDAVRRAWSFLLPEEKAEAIQWFTLEAEVLATFQRQLITYVVDSSGIDPGYWPVAEERAFFDPKVHAPAQPIPRRRLKATSSSAKSMMKRVHEVRPPRRIQRAWLYDWSTGELVQRPADDELERVFENALRGFAPDVDLAEALVLRALDTGEERVALAAFEHAYTDRGGRVFPLSLYEAWSSGVEIEMPDVDTLGIAHTVLDEHRRWVAPVPTRDQKSLYAAIGEEFSDARRYRGLREALASIYFHGTPELYDGYGESLVRFHSLWDQHASTPSGLAEALPRTSDDWTDYLSKWGRKVARDQELRDAGLTRQATLTADAARVRAMLVWVLEQLGAFERDALPEPEPEPEPEPDTPPEDARV